MSKRAEIFSYILSCHDKYEQQHGIMAEDIVEGPVLATLKEVHEALQYFQDEGLMYSTCDEHHFKLTQNDWKTLDHALTGRVFEMNALDTHFDAIKTLVGDQDVFVTELIDLTHRACKRHKNASE